VRYGEVFLGYSPYIMENVCYNGYSGLSKVRDVRQRHREIRVSGNFFGKSPEGPFLSLEIYFNIFIIC
jgi:hypothetical protein